MMRSFMSEERQPELPAKVYAEAVVRSSTGVSLLRSSSPVTAQNVTQFYAQPSLLNLAADRLQQAGFEVLDIGKTSISIAADPHTYERSFRTTLEAIERPVIKEMGKPDTATYINSIDDRPFGEIDLSHTEWNQILDGIAINKPVYYAQQVVPSATPPSTTVKYLQVPNDIAEGLNATLAHREGITGKGVRVVVVDSGCYPHPFFKQHNYQVSVVLGPDSTNPDEDEQGHGTGVVTNVLAVAPDVELIVVKADVALENNKFRNINPKTAFEQARSLNPDIISCSWGSDLHNNQLSPADRALAVVIAGAVKKGITVVCAAGNGQWGFPAQHPDVIAVGGVYKHLEGSLKGQLEASNYASSFVSQISSQRRYVPDVCGLVGQLPSGAYIMLPVAPGSIADRVHSALHDGTEATDGWAAASGTSSAAPQVAGICALMKQVSSDLSPQQIRAILQRSAWDVTEGTSNQRTGKNRAGPGKDLATGYGLADAYKSIQLLRGIKTQTRHNPIALFQSSKNTEAKRRKTMTFDSSKLRERLEAIQLRFEEVLQTEFKDIKDVELFLTEENFIPSSSIAKVAYSLRQSLNNCLDKKTGEVKESEIEPNHIAAAQGLLKLNKYQETATNVLVKALLRTSDSNDDINIRDLAIKALSECGFEIANFNSKKTTNEYSYFTRIQLCGNRGFVDACIDSNDDNTAHYTDGNGTHHYTRQGGCWIET